MMNTLWIFGDSFSWDYKIRLEHNNIDKSTDSTWKYIQEHLNGNIFDSWGEIVSKELNMNYRNYASYQTNIRLKNLGSGPTNNNNINLLNHFCSEFKQGDIVIFGFTHISRFEWANKEGHIITFLPSDDDYQSKEIIEQILVNRDEVPYYRYDTLQKLKSIETLSNLVGFDLWYWDWSNSFTPLVVEEKIPKDRWIFFQEDPTYIGYEHMMIYKYGVGNIGWETDNKIVDGHFGKMGHRIHGDILSKFLKNIKKDLVI
jgi:hypothetical protein